MAAVDPCSGFVVSRSTPCSTDPNPCNINSGFPGDEYCIPPPADGEGIQVHFGPRDYTNKTEVAEYILKANPDLVVLSDTKCCRQSAKTTAARAGWQNLSAVKHGRVIGVSDDIASRWGPRIVAFARVVAQAAKRS